MIGVGTPVEYLVWAEVGAGEWAFGAVDSYESVCGFFQRVWKVNESLWLMCCVAGTECFHSLSDVFNAGVLFGWREKFARYGDGMAVDSLTWTSGVVVLGGSAEAEQDPREVVCPLVG